MDKNVAYAHNGISLALKKREILPFATTWMNMLSDTSHRTNTTYTKHLDSYSEERSGIVVARGGREEKPRDNSKKT